MKIAVVMPVAPGGAERERCRDTVASIRAWEPAVKWILLLDDEYGRELDFGATTSVPHPLRTGTVEDRVAAATLAGFRWVRDHTDADTVMKIDPDALVIAPFAAKLERAFADPRVGTVGSYDKMPTGEPRKFRPNAFGVFRAAVRDPRFARILLGAVRHGYRPGEHVLGAAMAVSRRMVDVLPLDEPTRFSRTGLFDDSLLGVLTRHAGFRFAGAVDDLFALSWRGLPMPPQDLVERGYSITHCVKNDPQLSEAEIRGFFQARRHDLTMN